MVSLSFLNFRIYPRMLIGCLVGGLATGILGWSTGGVKTGTFAFTSLLTIPVFSPMWVYVIAITAAFFTSMFLVIISGYLSPEERAAAAAANVVEAPVAAAPVAVAVGAKEASQAQQWIAGMGGLGNLVKVDRVAETRVRVEVKDDSLVDEAALSAAGLPAVSHASANVWHLVAGFDADQYATEMRSKLAGANA